MNLFVSTPFLPASTSSQLLLFQICSLAHDLRVVVGEVDHSDDTLRYRIVNSSTAAVTMQAVLSGCTSVAKFIESEITVIKAAANASDTGTTRQNRADADALAEQLAARETVLYQHAYTLRFVASNFFLYVFKSFVDSLKFWRH